MAFFYNKVILSSSLLLFLIIILFISETNGVIHDPHKVLGLNKNASPEEIKKAFKSLSKKWHPDKNDNSAESQAKFVEVNEAYEILTDDTKRRQNEAERYNSFNRNNNNNGFGFGSFFQRVKPIFSDTFSLTYNNFDTMVDSSQDIWVIQFYTDRSSSCIEIAPIWDQVAKSLNEFVKFGRVNADEESALTRHFRIRNIPSVVVLAAETGNSHFYNGRIEFNSLTEYIKRLIPFHVSQINNEREWESFKKINNNKPHSLLFSKHSSTIAPLYRYISFKNSHNFNFAQITNENMENILASKFGVVDRPTIAFFGNDFTNPILVSGPFTKDSLTDVINDHRLIKTVEFQNENFYSLCGRKSKHMCGILFTNNKSRYFNSHLLSIQSLSLLSMKEVKLGWVDGVKYKHFLSFFNIAFSDTEQLNTLLLIDGKKRKYTIIKGPINKNTYEQQLKDLKFIDLPQDVPSLIEPNSSSIFDGLFSSIISFIFNNALIIVVTLAFALRVLTKL